MECPKHGEAYELSRSGITPTQNGYFYTYVTNTSQNLVAFDIIVSSNNLLYSKAYLQWNNAYTQISRSNSLHSLARLAQGYCLPTGMMGETDFLK